MGFDPLSPISFANINTLLVPAGKIKRSKLSSFVKSLQAENVVRLGDVSPDGQSQRSMSFCTVVRACFKANAVGLHRYIYPIGFP
jgi:hypothetical protein